MITFCTQLIKILAILGYLELESIGNQAIQDARPNITIVRSVGPYYNSIVPDSCKGPNFERDTHFGSILITYALSHEIESYKRSMNFRQLVGFNRN